MILGTKRPSLTWAAEHSGKRSVLIRAMPLGLALLGLIALLSAGIRLTNLPALPALRTLVPVQQAQTALGYEGYLGALQRYLAAPAVASMTALRQFQASGEQAIMVLQGLNEPALDVPAWSAVLTLYQTATGRIEDSLSSGQAPQPERYAPLYHAYQRLATLAATAQLADTRATQAALAERQIEQRTLLWWLWGGLLLSLAGIGWWWLQERRQLQRQSDMVIESADGQRQNVRFGAAAQTTFQSLIGELTRTIESLRSADMPATLQNVEELCRALARTVSLTHEELTASARAMRATGTEWQETAATSGARLTQLVSALETRAATVAEIAKLTGAQVQGSLSEIVQAQSQMRFAAGQVAATFTQSGQHADELSERLLAATNLLRASGKVLQETVDSVRTRMLDATVALTQTDARLTGIVEQNGQRLEALAVQAETMLSRSGEGQEAITDLLTASDRIHTAAQKLELSETELARAVTAMLAQSDRFGPLTTQLETLHQQLAESAAGSFTPAAQPDFERANARLETVADRLATLTDEMQAQRGAPSQPQPQLDMALQQMAKLGQLTETLSNMITQLDRTARVPAAAPIMMSQLPASDELGALRMNANLQLAQSQVGELLGRLTNDQQHLAEQVAVVQRTCEQIRNQRVDRLQLDDALANLGSQITQSHSNFTHELTAFVQRFEQAMVAAAESGEPNDSEPTVTPLARAILSKLRGDNGSHAVGQDLGQVSETATAALSLKDALARVIQIKKLTGALNTNLDRQGKTLATAAENTDAQAAAALAGQARALIAEVMSAINELSTTAQTITDTADQLQAG